METQKLSWIFGNNWNWNVRLVIDGYVMSVYIVCQTHAGCSCEYCIRAAFDGNQPIQLSLSLPLSSKAFELELWIFELGLNKSRLICLGFSSQQLKQTESKRQSMISDPFYRFLWEFRQSPISPDSSHTPRFTHLNSDTFSAKPNSTELFRVQNLKFNRI